MICYVVPPVGTSFVNDTALISLNGSPSVLSSVFNSLTSVGGVDTSRYTADTTGLSINASRSGVRVTTPSSVLKGCEVKDRV